MFVHTRLAIVLGPLIPCWETICIDFLYDTHLHQLFYSVVSNVSCFLQIFILPQLFNAPVWWRPNVVVVGELFRYSRLISIALSSKKCVGTVYTRSIQKVKDAVKVFCSSECWSWANIDSVMRYCVANHFLCTCVYDRVWPRVCNQLLLLFIIIGSFDSFRSKFFAKVIWCLKSLSLHEYDSRILSSVFLIEVFELRSKELKYAKKLLLNHYRKSVQTSMRLQVMCG